MRFYVMSTFASRKRLLEIARKDVGKKEASKNQAPWIEKLWPATSYPLGFRNREPYCAAGAAYVLKEWLRIPEVRDQLKMSVSAAELWRCKSAAVFAWETWAKQKRLQVLPKYCILKAGDLVIYSYSHIEIVSDDDNTERGPFTAIGYNTNAAGSRDGDGCFEKPRTRSSVKCFIRLMQ